jgi:hypothetical protein
MGERGRLVMPGLEKRTGSGTGFVVDAERYLVRFVTLIVTTAASKGDGPVAKQSVGLFFRYGLIDGRQTR